MTLPAHADAAKDSGHSIAFNLGAIALLVALAGLGLAYAIDAAGRAGHETQAGSVSRTLGGRELSIPAAWLREDAERSAGFAKQVDIGLYLPIGLGAEIWFAEGLDKLGSNIEEAQPTFMIVVPRLLPPTTWPSPETRWPTLRLRTLAPRAAMWPAYSCPVIIGTGTVRLAQSSQL